MRDLVDLLPSETENYKKQPCKPSGNGPKGKQQIKKKNTYLRKSTKLRQERSGCVVFEFPLFLPAQWDGKCNSDDYRQERRAPSPSSLQWEGFLPGRSRTSAVLILPQYLLLKLSPGQVWLRGEGSHFLFSSHLWKEGSALGAMYWEYRGPDYPCRGLWVRGYMPTEASQEIILGCCQPPHLPTHQGVQFLLFGFHSEACHCAYLQL